MVKPLPQAPAGLIIFFLNKDRNHPFHEKSDRPVQRGSGLEEQTLGWDLKFDRDGLEKVVVDGPIMVSLLGILLIPCPPFSPSR